MFRVLCCVSSAALCFDFCVVCCVLCFVLGVFCCVFFRCVVFSSDVLCFLQMCCVFSVVLCIGCRVLCFVFMLCFALMGHRTLEIGHF